MNMSAIPPAHWTLESLEAQFPHLQWREPKKFSMLGVPGAHYACPICIANQGIKGYEIGDLPTDPEVVRSHIQSEH